MVTDGLRVKLSKNEWIAHFDFKSHYPSRQQLNYFPLSWKLYANEKDNVSLEEFDNLCNNYCVLADVAFINLRIKKEVTAPYISKSKVLNKNVFYYNDWNFKGTDNGRVLNAYGVLLLTVTELDYKWIIKQYDTDNVFFNKVYISKRTEFPLSIRSECIDKYFIVKENGKKDGEYMYLKYKEWLNSIYGMTATDIVREECTYNFNEREWEVKKIKDDSKLLSEKLNKYYKSRNNFMSYQYGVYTTAHARNELFTLIEIIGYNNFIYSDTDSIFFICTDEILEKIKEYNNKIKAKKVGVQTKKGFICYGTFENEEEDIRRFKFLHAKCYGMECGKEHKLKITIAGVTKDNKKVGKDKITREQELQSLENLQDGFIFKECGGTRSIYTAEEPHIECINGHNVEIASSCVVVHTEKEIGGNLDYEEIFEKE